MTTDYPSGFEGCWHRYPHFIDPDSGTNRSNKAQSFRMWQRRGLEKLAWQVLAWIERYAESEQWQQEGHKYVPGFQKFIGTREGRDFRVGPPRLKNKAEKPPEQPQDGRFMSYEAAREKLKERTRASIASFQEHKDKRG